MKTYKIIVTDDIFGDLESTIEAESLQEAIDDTIEFYSMELGDNNINITSIIEY